MRPLDIMKRVVVVGGATVILMIFLLKGSYQVNTTDDTAEQLKLMRDDISALKDFMRGEVAHLEWRRQGKLTVDREQRTEDREQRTEDGPRFKARELLPGVQYPKILCWVMTDPKVLNRTYNVRDTWSNRCDKVLFMSSERNDSFPTIGLNVTAGRNHIAAKCKASWIYIYEHYINDFDFFVKADPDTYIVVENLKEYLSHFNPGEPQFFGHRYNMSWGIYMAGGPGVILSKSAVKRLVEKVLYNQTTSKKCMPDGQGEDWKVCKCLDIAGAKPVDTLDEKGRERFFVLNLGHIFHNKFPQWYRKRDRNKNGKECCSDYPIGFHYVGKDNFLVLEYLLYHAKMRYIDRERQLW